MVLYILQPKKWNCVNSGTGIQNTFQTDVTGISIATQLVALDQIIKFLSVLLNPSMTVNQVSDLWAESERWRKLHH